MSLEERLAELIAEAGDVQIKGAEYVRDGEVFALHLSTGVIELRLGPDIAEAARRTPDTASSPRGEDWIRFAPREWEQHAVDRLEAWFRVAWRLAAAETR